MTRGAGWAAICSLRVAPSIREFVRGPPIHVAVNGDRRRHCYTGAQSMGAVVDDRVRQYFAAGNGYISLPAVRTRVTSSVFSVTFPYTPSMRATSPTLKARERRERRSTGLRPADCQLGDWSRRSRERRQTPKHRARMPNCHRAGREAHHQHEQKQDRLAELVSWVGRW